MKTKANIEPYIYAIENIDLEAIYKIAETLVNVVRNGGRIFVAGNGGSHAIAQHFSCDLMKGVGMNSLCCHVINLTDNTAMLTALSNDIGYAHALDMQLEAAMVCDKDALITFSVSGNSTNIRNMVEYASGKGELQLISISGMASNKDIPFFQTDRILSLRVSTGYPSDSPLHYYAAECAFSVIAHEIARLFHVKQGNYHA